MGQLWRRERLMLYDTVRAIRPKAVFEVGTWRGGGSTYFLASALRANGEGLLHTAETSREHFRHALDLYARRWPELRPFVKFHFGDSLSVYPAVLAGGGRIDLLFLDGQDDPLQAMAEFRMFEPFLGSGSVFLMHDWLGLKASLLRPWLERSGDWEILEVLGDPELGFEGGSVGLVKAVRR